MIYQMIILNIHRSNLEMHQTKENYRFLDLKNAIIEKLADEYIK